MSTQVEQLLVKVSADVSQHTAAMNQVNNSLRAVDKQTRISSTGMLDFMQTFARISTTIYVSKMALDKIVGPIMDVGRTFDQNMAKMRSAGDLTTAQMQQASVVAAKLGNDMSLPGVSAADAGAAMMEMTRAGMAFNDVLAASPGVLALAKVGEIEVGEAALMTAKLLNAFSLGGEQAGHVADVLANAANASSANIKDLGFGMQQAGSLFAGAGYSVDDMAISLAMMSDSLIEGSDAGTSLKTMLMRLEAPTDKASEKLAAMVDIFDDSTGKMKPMRTIVDEVGKALGTMSQEEKMATMATVFGTDAIRAGNVVLEGGAAKWDEYAAKITTGKGAIKQLGDQMPEFEKAVENVSNTITDWKLKFWDKAVKPTLTKSLYLIMDFVTYLGSIRWEHYWGRMKDAINEVEYNRAFMLIEGGARGVVKAFDWMVKSTIGWWGVLKVVIGFAIARLVLLGIEAMASAVKQVAAWTLTNISAATSAATQVATFVLLTAKWIAIGVVAVAQAAIVAGAYILTGNASMISAGMQTGAMGMVITKLGALTTNFLSNTRVGYGLYSMFAEGVFVSGNLKKAFQTVSTELKTLAVSAVAARGAILGVFAVALAQGAAASAAWDKWGTSAEEMGTTSDNTSLKLAGLTAVLGPMGGAVGAVRASWDYFTQSTDSNSAAISRNADSWYGNKGAVEVWGTSVTGIVETVTSLLNKKLAENANLNEQFVQAMLANGATPEQAAKLANQLYPIGPMQELVVQSTDQMNAIVMKNLDALPIEMRKKGYEALGMEGFAGGLQENSAAAYFAGVSAVNMYQLPYTGFNTWNYGVGLGGTANFGLGLMKGTENSTVAARQVFWRAKTEGAQFPKNMGDIGLDGITGFKIGLTDPAIMGQASKDLYVGIDTGLRKEFDIHSPSHKMIELGKLATQGFVVGMLSSNPVGAFSDIIEDMRRAAKTAGMADWLNQQVGKPYIWGSGHPASPDLAGYDCSGLVSSALQVGGVPVAGTTYSLWDAIQHIPSSEIGLHSVVLGFLSDLSHVGVSLMGQWWESSGNGVVGPGQARSSWDLYGAPYGYAIGGISMRSGLAEVSKNGPEIHLTKKNIEDFGLNNPGIVIQNMTVVTPDAKSFSRDLEHKLRLQ